MITDDKFFEKAQKFCLIKSLEGEHKTVLQWKEALEGTQKDKDGNVVLIYSTDKDVQATSIADAKESGYEVMIFDHPIDSHFINAIEQKGEKVKFVRVDADIASKLIDKGEETKANLSEKEQEKLQKLFEKHLPKETYTLQFENMNEKDKPLYITENEFMRRMKDMSSLGGGGGIYGTMPEMRNVVVNANNPVIMSMLQDEKQGEEKIKRLTDLALLSKGLLKGDALNEFVKTSMENLKKQ